VLKFIKEMANESPIILFFLFATIAGIFANLTEMVVNIFRVCIGG